MKKKIFIISRFKNSGGAAIAAERLFRSLSSNNLFKLKHIFYKDNKNFYLFIKKKLLFYLEYGFLMFLDKNVLRSINFFNLISLNKYLIEPSSIINLHWFHSGLLSIEEISKIKNPLVITLHDSWFINKSSHYNKKFEFYKLNFIQNMLIKIINRWVLYRKHKINNISCFISPSKWIESLVLKDPYFSKFRIEVIPNPLDIHFFKPKKTKIKSTINVLTYFDNKINYLKGGDLLINFINSVNKKNDHTRKVKFIIVGNSTLNKLNMPNVINYGFLKSEKELLKIYQFSDICISFSRSENLPQFLTQAASCGLPLMGFNIEGIPEVILNDYNGILIKPYDIDSYIKNFNKLINDDNQIHKFSINSRNYAIKNWDQNKISNKYLNVFNSLKL